MHHVCIYGNNVTYKGENLQTYYQNIRSDKLADAFATATASAPTMIEPNKCTTKTPPPIYVTYNLISEELTTVASNVHESTPN